MFFSLVAMIIDQATFAQPLYKTSTGIITFFSSSSLGDIKASNQKVRAALNIKTGEILIKLRIEDFQFRKSLMQKHFKENYLESHLFPESQFHGKTETGGYVFQLFRSSSQGISDKVFLLHTPQ